MARYRWKRPRPQLHFDRTGDLPKIKDVLEKGANVNGGADPYFSALYQAASEGKNDAVKLLIHAGANVNQIEGAGNTALIAAVFYGHKETVKILLENGAA